VHAWFGRHSSGAEISLLDEVHVAGLRQEPLHLHEEACEPWEVLALGLALLAVFVVLLLLGHDGIIDDREEDDADMALRICSEDNKFFSVRLQPGFWACFGLIRSGVNYHLCNLPGISPRYNSSPKLSPRFHSFRGFPPQSRSFPGIPPQVSSQPTTARK
jgi:hypothetical protein